MTSRRHASCLQLTEQAIPFTAGDHVLFMGDALPHLQETLQFLQGPSSPFHFWKTYSSLFFSVPASEAHSCMNF